MLTIVPSLRRGETGLAAGEVKWVLDPRHRDCLLCCGVLEAHVYRLALALAIILGSGCFCGNAALLDPETGADGGAVDVGALGAGDDGGAPDAGTDVGATDGGTATCRAIDPAGYGSCRAEFGFAFDGNDCVLFSGCDCAPDCDAFYPSEFECRAACDLGACSPLGYADVTSQAQGWCCPEITVGPSPPIPAECLSQGDVGATVIRSQLCADLSLPECTLPPVDYDTSELVVLREYGGCEWPLIVGKVEACEQTRRIAYEYEEPCFTCDAFIPTCRFLLFDVDARLFEATGSYPFCGG